MNKRFGGNSVCVGGGGGLTPPPSPNATTCLPIRKMAKNASIKSEGKDGSCQGEIYVMQQWLAFPIFLVLPPALDGHI